MPRDIDPAALESISVSYAGITRIRFMGFEIHVYLISAGPTQLPVFNCMLRILLRVPRVNSQFHSVRLPVTPQASLASPSGRGGRAQRGRRGQAKNPTQNTRTPRFMNIFPALGKTVSYKALPHRAALP